MLEVGNGGMTADRVHRPTSRSGRCSSAPLLLGNDLRSVSAATLSIVENADVIAVNQDWGGSQGRRLVDNGDTEVWAKPMSDGAFAVVLLNRGASAATVSTTAAAIGFGGSYPVHDERSLDERRPRPRPAAIAATVPAHGVVMYRVSRAGSLAAAPAAGTFQVSDMTWLASSQRLGAGRARPVQRRAGGRRRRRR